MEFYLSHIITFIIGLIIGVFGTYWGNILTERHKENKSSKSRSKSFEKIRNQMPELINEIKEDLSNPAYSLCREMVIVSSKGIQYNTRTPTLIYYENEHYNLPNKINILESAGFISNITTGNAPKYELKEDFVEFLSNCK